MSHPLTSTSFLRYWLPVLAWTALIALLSSEGLRAGFTYRVVEAVLVFFFPQISPLTIQLVHLGVRKSAHIVEYCILTLLLLRAFRGDSSDGRYRRWAVLSSVVALSAAGLDEYHQSFTMLRSGSFYDVGFDLVGILLAQALTSWPVRVRWRVNKF